MGPLSFALISAGALLADRLIPKRGENGAGQSFDLLEFEPAQLNQFTHVLGPCRHFDIAMLAGMPAELMQYSAVPVEIQELAIGPRRIPIGKMGRMWMLVPQTPGAQNAADLLVSLVRDPRATVLGTHTLILPMRLPVSRFLFVGGPEAAVICAPRDGSPFAVIKRPGMRPPETVTAPPAVESEPAVAAGPVPAPAPVSAPGPSRFQEIRGGKVVSETVLRTAEEVSPPASEKSNGHAKKPWAKPEITDLGVTPPSEGAPTG